MAFDYKRVMEIAQRLEELGVPDETIKSIIDWAESKGIDYMLAGEASNNFLEIERQALSFEEFNQGINHGL